MKNFYIYTNQLKDKEQKVTNRIREYLKSKGCVCTEAVDKNAPILYNMIMMFRRNGL